MVFSSTHEGTESILCIIVLFEVFRTADLGQQYDTVSHVGGNFSFYIDTFILLCIRPTLVYSIPWDSPVRRPALSTISGSSLRGVVSRVEFSSNCYSFLGARQFSTRPVALPRTPWRTSRKIGDRLYHRTGIGRPAQGFSPTKLVRTTTSCFTPHQVICSHHL